ncbi:MAG: HIRAN domain-containing protein [Phoenicibacter congonensis]|uniref:HIRAN domain-containing protein n=1 Tax=Phoenicibacter congonensis TaxID=1944646 RepID=A0AA43RFY0_9ACTN|nr:HIRAN domain-containing protein [Phoenicibacter congonensis]
MDTGITTYKTDDALSTLLNNNKFGISDFSKPFAGEILLFSEARVAGTKNVFNIDEIVDELECGQRVKLQRDPHNLGDKWAVKIFDSKGRTVGYLSSDCSEVVSRLLGAGKSLFANVSNLQVRSGWHLIELEVYLDD